MTQNFSILFGQQEPVVEDEEFGQRLSRIIGIEGFQGEKRTDSVLENAGMDFVEIAQSYGTLAKSLWENPLDTVVAVGKNLPEALKESYTRWYDAYNEGVLGDAISAYPVQFIQDMTLPISIFFGGAAGIVGKGGSAVGKAGRMGRILGFNGGERTAAKALKTVAVTSDAFGILTDPFSGLIGAGARRVVSPLLAKQLQKRGIKPEPTTPSNVPKNQIIDELNTKSEPGKAASRIEDQKIRAGDALEDEITVSDVPRGNEYNNRERAYVDHDALLPVQKSILDDAVQSGNPGLEEIDFDISMINSKEDLQNVITNAIDIDRARRGVRTHQQTQAAANNIRNNYEDLLGRKLGESFNAEQALATVPIVDKNWFDMSELAKKVEYGDVNAEAELLKHAMIAAAITEQVSGVSAEAGRALNILKKIPEETRLRLEFNKNMVDNLGGGSASVKDLAKSIILANDKKALARTIHKAKEGGFKNMAIEAWINGLLSAPPTQVVNITSNAIVTGYVQGVENIATAGVGGIRKIFGGKNTMSSGEMTSRLRGLFYGMSEGMEKNIVVKEAFNEAVHSFKTEIPFGRSKVENIGRKAIPGFFGKTIVRWPGRLLTAGDAFFKHANMRSELAGLSYKEAVKEADEIFAKTGKKVSDQKIAVRARELEINPTNDISFKANKVADKNTYTSTLGGDWLTDLANVMLRYTEKNPVAKLILPFVTTPANIAKFALERTPLAFTFADYRAAIKAGGIARDKAIAQVALGSAAGLGVYLAAENGLVTGSAPLDRKKAELWRASGKQENSIKIGDTWYSFARLEPLGSIMGMAADMQGVKEFATTGEFDKMSMLVASSFARNITSKTFLKGFSDALKYFNNPVKGERLVQNLVASFVTPYSSLNANIARVEDPYLRQANSILERINARAWTFGDRSTLPYVVNIWGERRKYENLDHWAGKLFNPIYMQTEKNDKVTNTMLKIDAIPSMPGNRINGVKLTPEQHNAYKELAGQLSKQYLDELAATPDWDRMANGSPQDQAFLREHILDIIYNVRKQARNQIVYNDVGLQNQILQRNNVE
jgi:hypothetical protein